MVYYNPACARKILNHKAYRLNPNGSAPWQFQSFVFREIGARKHGHSGDRWDNKEIQKEIKNVAREWFDKNDLTPPKLYYEKFIFCKLLTQDQIKQFIAKFEIDKGAVLLFPIIGLIIEMVGFELTKELMELTGFEPDLNNISD